MPNTLRLLLNHLESRLHSLALLAYASISVLTKPTRRVGENGKSKCEKA